MRVHVAFTLALTTSLSAATFRPPCKLPFASIATSQAIDHECPESGTTTTPALTAQDSAKNNFCATGKPVVLTFGDFPGLQAAGDKVLGGPHYEPPPTRNGLRNLKYQLRGHKIGEGTLVTIVGYVEAAHYSDVSDGEGVNCRLLGDANNDVHIPVVAVPGSDECTSVTAEISPHFRPAVWTPGNVNRPKVPLRFTGQLFFDAEHRPCAGNTASGPKRQSVWEVHPVYAIDVCTATEASKCDAANAEVWKPLHEWVAESNSK